MAMQQTRKTRAASQAGRPDDFVKKSPKSPNPYSDKIGA
jgi:hypothetical protein